MSLTPKIYLPVGYVPTNGFNGIGDPSIIAAENMWLRISRQGVPYTEGYKGSLSLGETIPTKVLTGTIAWASTTQVITGTSTVFLDEIREGQFIFANNGANRVLIVVEQVLSNTVFKATKKPSTTGSTTAGNTHVLPVIQAIGTNRGTCIRGGVVQFPKGHIMGTGDGNFRVNGNNLNAPLTLSKKPAFALYNSSTGLYTQNDVGIDLPSPVGPATTTISIAAVTPTVATNMKAGAYNVRVTAKNTETLGFSNPSDALNVSQIVTITDGQAIRITFNCNMANDQNAWDIYCTPFTDNSTATVEARLMGPWYLVDMATATALGSRSSGTTYDISFADAEIQSALKVLTFDNFAPVDTEFVDLINGLPIYFSCLGQGNSSKLNGTSPGPSAVPGKPTNPEAVYLNKAFTTAGGDLIIGEFNAKSIIYVLCQNSLQTVLLTTLDSEPIAFRSLWFSGFRNPYNVTFAKNYLYGFSTDGMVRSVAGADDTSIEWDFATDLAVDFIDEDCGQMLAGYCPRNKAVCVFQSAKEKRNGFWVTKVWPYLIERNVWSYPIVLYKTNQDFIVSGVAKIGNKLVMVAGGANNSGTVSVDTYIFDGGDSENKSWFLGFNYNNDGTDDFLKRLKGFSLSGKFKNGAIIKIYGTGPDGIFKIDDFKDGINENFSMSLTSTGEDIMVKNYNFADTTPFTHYAIRLEGVNEGLSVDRFDKLGVNVEINSSRVS